MGNGGGGGHHHVVYQPDYAAIERARLQQVQQHNRHQAMLKQQQQQRDRLQEQARENQRQRVLRIQQAARQQQLQNQRIRQNQQRRLQQIRQQQRLKQQELKRQNQEILRKNQQRLKQLEKPIVKTDPNQIKNIEATKKQIQSNQKQLKQLLNPQNMKANEQSQIQIYLKHLQSKKWEDNLNNKFGVLHNIVAGDISAGKSSSLNFFFGLNQKIGVDQTTQGAKIVKKSQKLCIWDSPGVNQKFDTFEVEVLKLFASANKVFLLFEKSLKCRKNNVRILAACKNNKNFYCIRTMCDKFSTQSEMKQALKKDKQILQKWGLTNVPVFGISSLKSIDFADNKIVKQLISN